MTPQRGLAPGLDLGRRSHLGYQTARPAPYTARVTLKTCEARGLSVYQVAMSGHAQCTADPGTVYRLARGDTSRIDLHTLATLAGILHTLTGQPVTVGGLLSPTLIKYLSALEPSSLKPTIS